MVVTLKMKDAGEEMTPKQQYEARKAERKKLEEMDFETKKRTTEIAMLDTFDRFVTAAERIADALESSNNLRATMTSRDAT